METKRLYKMAERGNVAIDFTPLPSTKAFCIVIGGKKYIAIDKGIRPESNEERVVLAHELGHLKADALYGLDSSPIYRRRLEKRADGIAFGLLVPLRALKQAIKSGDESVSALAEHFSVTEDFMQKAIKYYSEKRA